MGRFLWDKRGGDNRQIFAGYGNRADGEGLQLSGSGESILDRPEQGEDSSVFGRGAVTPGADPGIRHRGAGAVAQGPPLHRRGRSLPHLPGRRGAASAYGQLYQRLPGGLRAGRRGNPCPGDGFHPAQRQRQGTPPGRRGPMSTSPVSGGSRPL